MKSLVVASDAQSGGVAAGGLRKAGDLQGHVGVDPPSTETHDCGNMENVFLRLGIEPARDPASQLELYMWCWVQSSLS